MSLKLHGYLDSSVPLIVFGHSLGELLLHHCSHCIFCCSHLNVIHNSGGIIAFELIKHIERFLPGGSSLRHAVLSSINSPTELLRKYADPASEVPKKHLMGDDLFIADMHALGGNCVYIIYVRLPLIFILHVLYIIM